MAIINDDLFENKKITDILKEYYTKTEDDRSQIDELIQAMKIDKPLISPFEAEGRAKLLGVLLDAKQKTTQGLANIANIAARLQSNASKISGKEENDDLFLLASKHLNNEEVRALENGVHQPLLDKIDDGVEDLVSGAKNDKKTN